MRTFLILAALVVSGIGFARLTHKEDPMAGGAGTGKPVEAQAEGIQAKVYLSFSSLPGFIGLKVGEETVTLKHDKNSDFSGSVAIDPDHPVVYLKVACASPFVRNFAKLVVEAEGEETFTHVFDAAGDIDDFVELPF